MDYKGILTDTLALSVILVIVGLVVFYLMTKFAGSYVQNMSMVDMKTLAIYLFVTGIIGHLIGHYTGFTTWYCSAESAMKYPFR
jgi:hypothetical protein